MKCSNKRQLKAIIRVALFSMAFNITAVSSGRADPVQDPPAETPQETAANAQHISLLRNEKFAQLDGEMNQIQRDYESGQRDDINLAHLFRAFYDTDPALEDKFKRWLQTFPRSYAAYEAQGIYFRRVGFQARGTRFGIETTAAQFNELQKNLNLAMKSHQTALSLTKKPMLTYYDILSIAKLAGDRDTANRMLELANKSDPKNYIVRYKYMLMLESRWGGSLEAMKRFRVDAENAGLPDRQLKYFDELISDEMRWTQH